MQLLEWSDYILKVRPFVINWSAVPLDSYNEYYMYLVVWGISKSFKGTVDDQEQVIVFHIFWEDTEYCSWKWTVEFWGFKDEKKQRLNKEKLQIRILPSIRPYVNGV
mgnify:CR=1 FL=1